MCRHILAAGDVEILVKASRMAASQLAGQVGKSRKVLVCSKPLRLKAANLARRSRTAHDGFAADDPAHCRIMTQALGVIHILVSGKATKYRLSEQPGQYMPTILTSTYISYPIPPHHANPSYV